MDVNGYGHRYKLSDEHALCCSFYLIIALISKHFDQLIALKML